MGRSATIRGVPLELRQCLDILKRHKWFIIGTVILGGLAAGIGSGIRTPSYQADASVLLRPGDPSEVLDPADASRVGNDPDRYVEGQRRIVESEGVTREALKSLPGVTAREVEDRVSVSQGGQSDVLSISARHPDPVRARDIANAVAEGYIENRRQAAVAGLQRVADDIQAKLGPILKRIAELDVQVAALPVAAAAPPGSAATQPSESVDQQQDAVAGGQPTTTESLKAARYALAVQYEELYGRQQQLLIEIGLKRGEAEIVAEAKAPTAPVSPRPKRDAAFGALVGLLVGTGIVFLREQLDDRVRSASEVERITGLPLLAQLPHDEATAKCSSAVAVADRPNAPLSEAMRSLRTSVQYLGVDRPIKVIVVTSAVPGEGKSLVAANLAAVFAKADYRTLLISADLRRSSINALFGDLGPSVGLTGIMTPLPFNRRGTGVNAHGNEKSAGNGQPAGNRSMAHRTTADALLHTSIPGLSLLPSGATPPNPAELLGSRRMAGILTESSSLADIVVIDTPPLLPVTDAAVLAAQCDGVILVAALNESRRDATQRAKAILEGTGARLLGTVVNKAPSSRSGYYGGYYGDDSDVTTARRRPPTFRLRKKKGVAQTAGERANDPSRPRRHQRGRRRDPAGAASGGYHPGSTGPRRTRQ